MFSFSKWLDRVCELHCISRKNFVQFYCWFVNDYGDMVAYTRDSRILAFTISRYALIEYSKHYNEAKAGWLDRLKNEKWMNKNAVDAFGLAFNLAWSKGPSTDKTDKDFYNERTVLDMCDYGRGIPSPTDCYALGYDTYTGEEPDKQNQEKDTPIILEFSESQQCFNFNSISRDGIPYRGGSEYYATVAETTWHAATPFVRLMKARRYNGAIFTFDQVVAEWNYYVFLILQINSNIESYGMFKKPSPEDLVRIEKRVNAYNGEYAENEQMKLRTIGVPKISE